MLGWLVAEPPAPRPSVGSHRWAKLGEVIATTPDCEASQPASASRNASPVPEIVSERMSPPTSWLYWLEKLW
jgi:hypothetical protein